MRTLKRDAAWLRRDGVLLPTRGNLQGIGRGQTHKAVIVSRWLQGQTYDQLARTCRHAPTSIRRYVETFIRVVWFQRHGYSREQMALLLGIGTALVDEYLTVYRQHDLPQYAERLQICLERVCVYLQEVRAQTGEALPTMGHHFDLGMRPTHKGQIVELYEAGVDEVEIARRSGHSQASVGHYIRDYERVKLPLSRQMEPGDIPVLAMLAPTAATEHVRLVLRYHPELAPQTPSPTQPG